MLLTRIFALVQTHPKEVTRFVKFATVGAFGMIIDLTILNVMYRFILPPLVPSLAAAHRLLVANSISFTAAVISNFTWNRLWTFPESRQRPIFRQFGQFALVNVLGLGINNLVLLVAFSILHQLVPDPYNYNAAKMLAIGVVLFWNFGINRIWTYRGL